MKFRSEFNLPKLSTIGAPLDPNEVSIAIDSNAKMVLTDSLGNTKTLASNDDLENKENIITNPPVSKGGTGINDLTGQANKVLAVNSTANGYTLVDSGGSPAISYCSPSENLIINGDFRINQRQATSKTDTSKDSINNRYSYDRWYVDTTLKQWIEEGSYVPSATYTLSGVNITTQEITSPVSGNWLVDTGSTDPNNVVLCLGNTVKTFAPRETSSELSICQRYFCKTYSQDTAIGTATGFGAVVKSLDDVQSFALLHWSFPQTMRITPTVISYSTNTGASGQVSADNLNYPSSIPPWGDSSTTIRVINISIGKSVYLQAQVIADAEIITV